MGSFGTPEGCISHFLRIGSHENTSIFGILLIHSTFFCQSVRHVFGIIVGDFIAVSVRLVFAIACVKQLYIRLTPRPNPVFYKG